MLSAPLKRRRLLGDQHGLALRQDQYLGRGIRNPGDAGEKPEEHERIVVGADALDARAGSDALEIDAEAGMALLVAGLAVMAVVDALRVTRRITAKCPGAAPAS